MAMTSWTVFQPAPAGEQPDRSEWPDGVVFVRERFSRAGLVLGPLVLLWHRLWIAFAGYVVLAGAWFVLVPHIASGWPVAFLDLLPHLLVGHLLADLRRWTLRRAGYQEIGTVVAPDLPAAERRFFEAWLASGAGQSTDTVGSRPTLPPAAANPRSFAGRDVAPPVLGLFPEAGRP
ncbi:DUF2628 domain-containing protein [Ancylobacter sp. 6x-1]|uniref:DUF2628 domain-containing protein n=1 Tax=Ancylobacter crimeensis TaxID=2579147 RepID=A0ABT0DC13_9HYPH|nr:DUF2628 domain-containing protein [Ancylobacter crimeensis]MCK0197480.1 DUF2628 domain-containing protein [Ancylobacter crimeensis]